jgi:hypothetical protein
MKSYSSIQVVRMWCGSHINPVLRCFVDAEGQNYGDLLVDMAPELMSWLTV